MSGHTPGPWPLKGWSAGDSQGWQIRLGTHENAQRIDVDRYSAESDANARLIAAAPDLLAALRELLDLGQQESIEDGELEAAQKAARAAIARAKGGQP